MVTYQIFCHTRPSTFLSSPTGTPNPLIQIANCVAFDETAQYERSLTDLICLAICVSLVFGGWLGMRMGKVGGCQNSRLYKNPCTTQLSIKFFQLVSVKCQQLLAF